MISHFALLYVHRYMLFSSWLTKWLMEPNINSILCSLSSLWHLLSRHWYMIYSPVPYCVSSICFFPESIYTPFYIFNFSRMLLAMARYFFFHYLIFLKRIHFLFKKKKKGREGEGGKGRREGEDCRLNTCNPHWTIQASVVLGPAPTLKNTISLFFIIVEIPPLCIYYIRWQVSQIRSFHRGPSKIIVFWNIVLKTYANASYSLRILGVLNRALPNRKNFFVKLCGIPGSDDVSGGGVGTEGKRTVVGRAQRLRWGGGDNGTGHGDVCQQEELPRQTD